MTYEWIIFLQSKESKDEETNMECAYNGNDEENNRVPAIIIKRSQTFSPNANNHFICKVSYLF